MANLKQNTTPSERGELIAAAKAAISKDGRLVTPTSLAAHMGCGEGTVQRWLTEQGDGARVGIRCRMPADTRKDKLLTAALTVAERDGFLNMTRKAIALEAYVSVPLVNTYLGKMGNIRKTVMTLAIKHELLPIIAQGLATGNAYAQRAPADLKERALATLK